MKAMSGTAVPCVGNFGDEHDLCKEEKAASNRAVAITAIAAIALGLLYSVPATLLALALLGMIALAAYMLYQNWESALRVRHTRSAINRRKAAAALGSYLAFAAVLLLSSAACSWMGFAEFWKAFGAQILLLPGVLVLVYACGQFMGEGR